MLREDDSGSILYGAVVAKTCDEYKNKEEMACRFMATETAFDPFKLIKNQE